jgi:hypothetical protein
VPFSYRIDRERRIAFVEVKGLSSFQEILQLRREILNDSAFDPSMKQLIDLTQLDIKLESPQIRELALSDTHRDSQTRVAFLIDPWEESLIRYGLLRMFESYREVVTGDHFEIFTDREEALKWLCEY